MRISKFQSGKKGRLWLVLIALLCTGIGGAALFLPTNITKGLVQPLREIAGTGFRTDAYPLRIILPGAALPASAQQRPKPLSADANSQNLDALPADDEPSNQADTLELAVTGEPGSIAEKNVPAGILPDKKERLAPEKTGPPSLSGFNFDLRGGPDAPDTIEVEKTVQFAGSDAGKITVRIDKNAKIYARGEQLASILPATSARPAIVAEGFRELDQLRQAGFNIHYDATHDKIILALNEQ